MKCSTVWTILFPINSLGGYFVRLSFQSVGGSMKYPPHFHSHPNASHLSHDGIIQESPAKRTPLFCLGFCNENAWLPLPTPSCCFVCVCVCVWLDLCCFGFRNNIGRPPATRNTCCCLTHCLGCVVLGFVARVADTPSPYGQETNKTQQNKQENTHKGNHS